MRVEDMYAAVMLAPSLFPHPAPRPWTTVECKFHSDGGSAMTRAREKTGAPPPFFFLALETAGGKAGCVVLGWCSHTSPSRAPDRPDAAGRQADGQAWASRGGLGWTGREPPQTEASRQKMENKRRKRRRKKASMMNRGGKNMSSYVKSLSIWQMLVSCGIRCWAM
ncbi:hypothetical protein BS50DRAFT_264372 [Corynespora cassiicola Philippines]|uniref:Uncharacterized protein n=1 Tax=Corynespora cassiicola Philippines TaxID=1448308 RepID=A0A2T2NZQ9_CORCC|nr:hypothetical protein BS50DRAFT_264372 [Corynespora cassiicola Philippines]